MPEINASTLTPEGRIHALLVGPSGVGKSGAAMSFDGKCYVLDFDDRGKGAAMGCSFLQEKRLRGDIIINRILPWIGQTPQGLEQVYNVLEALDARVTKGEIQNVLLDGTTSMKRFFINESVNRALATSGNSNSLKHFQIGKAVMPGKPDHNYAAICMANVIYDNLKTFKCNVFISTHIQDKWIISPTPEDPERVISVGETITAPGQLKGEIPSWFDEVWEFSIDASATSQRPTRYVQFEGKWAHTSFADLGEMQKGVWVKKYKFDITGKSLQEVLRPTFERMKAAPPQVEVVKK